MFTVAIVASDPSDKASAAEFASSSLNAAVVFRDSVAAALEHSPLFDCIIACEDSFRDALKDRSLFIRLSGTTVLCLSDKLFFKIDLSQKGSSRSEARARALLSSLMAKCGFRRGTLGCSYIQDAVLCASSSTFLPHISFALNDAALLDLSRILAYNMYHKRDIKSAML